MRGSNGGFGILRTSALGRSFWARHSSTNLFVGGLSYDTNEPVLKEAFGKHGEIIEVKVICDHVSGKSKGYGFVKFTSGIEASTALKEMDGQLLDGRQIRLEFAHKGNPWNAKKIRPEQVSLNASLRLQEFLRVNECLGSHSGQGQTKQKWQTPHANALKINVDGAWKLGTAEGGVGVVVRDSTGKFVAGCAVKLVNVFSARQVEALAARTGTVLAMKRGFQNVVFESDALHIGTTLRSNSIDRFVIGPVMEDTKSLHRSLGKVLSIFVALPMMWLIV